MKNAIISIDLSVNTRFFFNSLFIWLILIYSAINIIILGEEYHGKQYKNLVLTKSCSYINDFHDSILNLNLGKSACGYNSYKMV